jgi:hypothetical protein
MTKTVEEMYRRVKPLVEKMKAKYPAELNMEGLEPALTSDTAEIALEVCLADRKERDRELAEKVKEMCDYPCSCERRQEFCTHDYNTMHAVLALLSPDINHNEK